MYIKALKQISVFALVTNLFYGAFAIIQIKFFKKVIIPSITIKIILSSFLLIWIIHLLLVKRVRLLISQKVAIFYLLWLGYSLFSFFLLFRLNYPISYIIFSFMATMFYPAFMLFYIFGPQKLEVIKKMDLNDIYFKMSKLLLISAFIIWPLGMAQYFFNSPIIQTNINDDYWKIMSQNFFGHIRATSFFSSALEYGLFSLTVLSIYFSKHMFYRKSIFNVFIIVVSIVNIYITLTRNIYLTMVFALSTLVVLKIYDKKIDRQKLLLYILPLIYLLISVLIIYVTPIIRKVDFRSLTNDMSLYMRLNEWDYYLKFIFNGNIFDLLFGYGLIQNDRFDLTKNIIIDNTYLALVLYQGLIGLVLYMCFYFSLWIYLVKISIKNRNYFEIALMSILSSYLVRSFFNIAVFGDYLNFILLFWVLIINKFNNLVEVSNESSDNIRFIS